MQKVNYRGKLLASASDMRKATSNLGNERRNLLLVLHNFFVVGANCIAALVDGNGVRSNGVAVRPRRRDWFRRMLLGYPRSVCALTIPVEGYPRCEHLHPTFPRRCCIRRGGALDHV